MYVAPKALSTKHVNVLHKVAPAPAGLTDGVFLNRHRYILRGYNSACLYRHLGAAPRRFPLPSKGESVTRGWRPGHILIGSEGRDSKIWQVRLP